jgi:uncharacterized protein YjbI with pentapeptide repeats
MKRVYLEGEDISQAIFNSGLKLRTVNLLGTNLLGTKLDTIAEELNNKLKARVFAELREFGVRINAELREFEEKVLF